jgi:hypothetical protein
VLTLILGGEEHIEFGIMHVCFKFNSTKSQNLINSIKRSSLFGGFSSVFLVNHLLMGASLIENTHQFSCENREALSQLPRDQGEENAIRRLDEPNTTFNGYSGTNDNELLNEEEDRFKPSPYKAAIQEMFEWLLALPKERLERTSKELDQGIVDAILRMIKKVPLVELWGSAYLHAISGAFFCKYGGHCDENGEECEHGPYEFHNRETMFTTGPTSGAIEDVIFPNEMPQD